MLTSTLKPTRWGVATLLVLLIGCKKTADVTPDSQGCQLQSEQSTSTGQTTAHAYNSSGQRIKSVVTSANSTITYTYTYDEAGKIISATTKGSGTPNIKFDVIGTYEYTGGRLTKIIAKSLGDSPSMTDTYTYDDAGRIATHTYTSSGSKSIGAEAIAESYTFTNGVLTAGAITRGDLSVTLTVGNGRIASLTYPDGRKTRYTYDANGYQIRSDSQDKTGASQGYTIREYSATPYKDARSLPGSVTIPRINLYGNTELPRYRVADYDASGNLKTEERYQYQTNKQGYITNLSFTQNQIGVGNGQSSGSTVYTYSNCP